MDYINNLQAMTAVDEFASALVNLSSRDDIRVDDIIPLYEMLKQWIQNYENNYDEKYYNHVQILANMTSKDDDIETWLSEMEQLYAVERSEHVAPYYAIALCNFTHVKTDDAYVEDSDFNLAINKIKNLMSTHGEDGIAEWYCKALCNYLYFHIDVSVPKGISIANDLSTALISYFSNDSLDGLEDLIVAFTDIIKVYCDKDDLDAVTDFEGIIKELSSAFPQIIQFVECVAFIYMKLANLHSEDNETKAIDANNEIRKIYNVHSDNELIAIYFADAIAALSTFLSNEELGHELLVLAKIYKKFSQEFDVADSYLLSIKNFSAECEPSLIEALFYKALRVFNTHSEDDEEEELLENCVSIIDDFLTGTGNTIKAEEMLNSLKEIVDFEKIESDECKETVTGLLDTFKKIQNQ